MTLGRWEGRRGSLDSTAIWFGSGYDAMAAIHYYLHPSDARVFTPAIAAASGHTDAFAAAHAIARAEEALFGYDLNGHGHDVIHLLTTQKTAQCADDASRLTAFLRAVGIPAHPVTADASAEHLPPGVDPDDAWGFDTWVEFLASHDGAVDWRIFHPHQYPGMAAESRGTFGTSRDVATKHFNDIVIMANTAWLWSDANDPNMDVTYDRNECLEPEQEITKASWVDELCEAGYWPKTHWDCSDVHANAIRSGLDLEDESLRFGAPVNGTLHLENTGRARIAGTVRVEIFGSRPEVKRFIETPYGEVVADAALEPDARLDIPFRLDLPETAPPGQVLVLRTLLERMMADVRELRPPIGVTAELAWQAADGGGIFAAGEESTVRVVVRTVSDEVVREVSAEVDAPYAVRVADRRRELGELQPRQEAEVSWSVWTTGPLDAGILEVAVATANSGGLLLRRGFRVQDDAGIGEVGGVALLV